MKKTKLYCKCMYKDCPNLHYADEIKTDKSNGWVEEYFNLYKKGRENNAPSGYIDYYKARHLMSKAVDKAVKEERMRFVEMLGEEPYARAMYEANYESAKKANISISARNNLRQDILEKMKIV